MAIHMVESFLVSASVVGLAEIGDRTQFLSLALACHYRRPISIICGILLATFVGNTIAAYAGTWMSSLLTPFILKWVLILSFIVMAIWVLIPEKRVSDTASASKKKNAFVATFLSFLVAEMGDKTQLATASLAVHFEQLWPVILGSTAGMMLVNTPVVLGSHCLDDKISTSPIIRYIASGIFIVEAIITFCGYQLF